MFAIQTTKKQHTEPIKISAETAVSIATKIELTHCLARHIRQNRTLNDSHSVCCCEKAEMFARRFSSPDDPRPTAVGLDVARKKKWIRPGETWKDTCTRVGNWLATAPLDIDQIVVEKIVKKVQEKCNVLDYAEIRRICEQEAYLLVKPEYLLGTEYRRCYYTTLTQHLLVAENTPCFLGSVAPHVPYDPHSKAQLAACFVFDIDDSLFKDRPGDDHSIMGVLVRAVFIQSSGGGTGFNFSNLRPRGSSIIKTGGESPGPIAFMQMFDGVFGWIQQGGVRRGANMAVLRVDHPDIVEFIHCKVDPVKNKQGKITGYKSAENRLTNFNVSVALTDEFMYAVMGDQPFNLVFNGKVYHTMPARELFYMIADRARFGGEPGVLFIDTANRYNPIPVSVDILDMFRRYFGAYLTATNPCGEQWLEHAGNCNLGHLALDRMALDPNLDAWEELVWLSVEMLHSMNFINSYAEPYPEFYRAAYGTRRLGLGIMGLADMLIVFGIRYGSDESLGFMCYLMHFIVSCALVCSIEMAKRCGPFPYIHASVLHPGSNHPQMQRYRDFLRTDPDYIKHMSGLPNSVVDKCPPALKEKFDAHRTNHKERFENALKDLDITGMAHATLTTVAPVGTTGTVAGCEGYGCEPIFSFYHKRHMIDPNNGNQTVEIEYKSKLLIKALKSHGLTDADIDGVFASIANGKKLAEIENVPQNVKDVFVVSGDLTLDDHINVVAIMSRYVCNSVSKTCNAPADTSTKDVQNAIVKAWELGCKGFTIYVENSREKVVLERIQAQVEDTGNLVIAPRKTLSGITHFISSTNLIELSATLNCDEKGPFEVYIHNSGNGMVTDMFLKMFGILFSKMLRIEQLGSPRERMEMCVQTIRKISQSTDSYHKGRVVNDAPFLQYVTQCLEKITAVDGDCVCQSARDCTVDAGIFGKLTATMSNKEGEYEIKLVSISTTGETDTDLASAVKMIGIFIEHMVNMKKIDTRMARWNACLKVLKDACGSSSATPKTLVESLCLLIESFDEDMIAAISKVYRKTVMTNNSLNSSRDDILVVKRDFCPSCHNIGMVKEEGCKRCYNCGFSYC